MLTLRKSGERGHVKEDWLESYHTFSFADYYDPNHMGFSVLRVINEDWIAEGEGFPMHPHRDMEILTYVMEGALEHKDSMGNSEIIRPEEVQRMSAGTGVRHSEFNHFKDKKTHLLQIWILPDKEGLKPGYEQKSFAPHFKEKQFFLVASKTGREGSVSLSQDANVFAGKFKESKKFTHEMKAGRNLWAQVIQGKFTIDGIKAQAGDGVYGSIKGPIEIEAEAGSEFLLFDMK